MLLKKGNFYVIEIDRPLLGFDENGEQVIADHTDELDKYIVIFFNEPDTETDINAREATELEKEYWFESMQESDETDENNYSGVSLGFFQEWKESKGIY